MFRLLVIAIFVALPAHLLAQGDSIPKKKAFVGKAIDGLVGVVKEFNNIDTAFIEPQHYKFTTTLMSTYTFETYRIRSSSGQTVRFYRPPGGYYTWRNVNNAFYAVTTGSASSGRSENGNTPREELMDKIFYINAEITYKRTEFGLPVANAGEGK